MKQQIVLYKITNIINQKAYIGWTNNFTRRWHEHIQPSSECICLNRAIQKYGVDKFAHEILEFCPSDNYAKLLEIAAIKGFSTKVPNGYNMTNGGDGALGRTVSKSTRQKLSAIHKGKTITEQHKQKIGAANKGNSYNKGRKHTDETKRKNSEWHKGKQPWNKGISPTPKTRRKISINNGRGNKGKQFSEKHKQKISEGIKKCWIVKRAKND